MQGLISCYMSTYNRVTHPLGFVHEAVYSFLNQDYGQRELIILNDTPGQTLVFDHPLVKVINARERFPTLSHKINHIVAVAQGDYVATWDDDDICLPWRLSYSLRCLQEAGVDYYNPAGCWIKDNKDKLTLSDKMYLPASLCTRRLWDDLGGHPEAPSGSDSLFYKQIPRQRALMWQRIPPYDVYYIYCWRLGEGHVSAGKNGYRRLGGLPITAGTYRLQPAWRQNYLSMVRRHLVDNGL